MIGHLIRPELEELIRDRQWDVLRDALVYLHPSDIAELLVDIPASDDAPIFRVLPREVAGEVFAYLPHAHQEQLIRCISNEQMRSLLEAMSPDDQTRLLEELPPEVTRRVIESLSPEELRTARELLGYPPESAGRFMTPEYVAIPADSTAGEALDYVRQHGRDKETVNVLYVLDDRGKLLQDIRLGALVMADPPTKVRDIEGSNVSLPATADREEAVRMFEKYDRFALPVTDSNGHMLGIITSDDILDVVTEEATEDIQKIGGMEALDEPYMDVGFLTMLRKRGGWLSVLFIGEMLTTTAMGYFEAEIERAVVLAIFIPLIISSGGNSGSQASTLMIRALALEEVKLRDWRKVLVREFRTSLALGAWLGALGLLRIIVWQKFGWFDFSEHYVLVSLVVCLSLLGVVCFGSVIGSMLPFALRKLGFDPATSSAPFVATLVDVTGLLIYFTCAILLLRGTLL